MHRRRGREEWRRICAASDSAGLSVKEFAVAAGVHPRTLGWWRAEFRRERRREASVWHPGFVELAQVQVSAGGERVVVRVGEVAVELEGLPPAAWLAELAGRC